MRLPRPVIALVAGILGLSGSVAESAVFTDNVRASAQQLRIVFAARERVNGLEAGLQGIYTADGDGANIKRITGNDGLFYNWPVWAMNGTKIVFTARLGVPDSFDPEGEDDILMMDPDGSHRVQLTRNSWRNAQPKITPDGRSLIFSSAWPEYFKFGIYRLDLATLEVENLTSTSGIDFGLDADPKISADGSTIVFASASNHDQIGRVAVMGIDGRNRRELTHDNYSAFDPSFSPNQRFIAYSSYRGGGSPTEPGQSDPFRVRLSNFHLVVLDTTNGKEQVLTEGKRCVFDDPPNCTPTQASAYEPQWSPDGKRIGFISATGLFRQGIYSINPDGTGARAIIETANLSIFWWDWATAGVAPAGAVERVGSAISSEKLLFGGPVYSSCGQLACDSKPTPTTRFQLFAGSRDRWTGSEILPSVRGLVPDFARWSPDRSHIVFTAEVDYDPSRPVNPPFGALRHTHFTLLDLTPGYSNLVEQPGDMAREQVFLMDATGKNVRQLTTPWTEDLEDGLPEGDLRANRWPDFSPDGRFVIFTNTSIQTGESFILRMDLINGDVISLTNMTAGAYPVADFEARYSPDGSRIAFASAIGRGTEIFIMNANGLNVHQVTDDGYVNFGPSWSPDGGRLAYSSYRGTESLLDLSLPETANRKLPMTNWNLIKLDLSSLAQSVLNPNDAGPAWSSTWAPDGSRIAFVGIGVLGQTDIMVVNPDGSNWRRLQATLSTKERFVDWR